MTWSSRGPCQSHYSNAVVYHWGYRDLSCQMLCWGQVTPGKPHHGRPEPDQYHSSLAVACCFSAMSLTACTLTWAEETILLQVLTQLVSHHFLDELTHQWYIYTIHAFTKVKKFIADNYTAMDDLSQAQTQQYQSWMTYHKPRLNSTEAEFWLSSFLTTSGTLQTVLWKGCWLRDSSNLSAFFHAQMIIHSHVNSIVRPGNFHVRSLVSFRRCLDKPTVKSAAGPLIHF